MVTKAQLDVLTILRNGERQAESMAPVQGKSPKPHRMAAEALEAAINELGGTYTTGPCAIRPRTKFSAGERAPKDAPSHIERAARLAIEKAGGK